MKTPKRFKQVFIEGEKDLPKEQRRYIVHEKHIKDQTWTDSYYFDIEDSPDVWLTSIDWYLIEEQPSTVTKEIAEAEKGECPDVSTCKECDKKCYPVTPQPEQSVIRENRNTEHSVVKQYFTTEQSSVPDAEEILTKYSDGHYTQFKGYENILKAMEEYATLKLKAQSGQGKDKYFKMVRGKSSDDIELPNYTIEVGDTVEGYLNSYHLIGCYSIQVELAQDCGNVEGCSGIIVVNVPVEKDSIVYIDGHDIELQSGVQKPSDEDVMVYFNNHSNCYADTGNKAVVPAMTRSEVLVLAKWMRERLNQTNKQ